MSRFTEVHVAHVLETTSETWWGDWRCICGQEGRVAHALDLSRTLKDLQIRRAHAAHVESMLVEAGVVAVELPEQDEAETEWGVEVPRYGDSKPVVLGPDSRAAMTHFANSNPNHRLMCRAVTYGPWLPIAAVRPVTPEEPR